MINLSNSIENISYQGIVNIKIVDTKYNIIKDSFIIKNNGTKHLFKYLCDCLIQNYNPSNAPQFLDASTQYLILDNKNNLAAKAKDSNSTDSYSSGLTNRARLSNVEVKTNFDESNYKAMFSGIILYDQLRDKKEGLRSLVLFPNKNAQDISKPLAFINMVSKDAKEGITLSVSEVLVLEWELQFTNAS